VQRAKRIVMAITGLTDDRAAADLLDAADREVKTAIVMHKRGVDAAEARRLLAAAGGMLRAVIG
jgi:N-acetylmuramic acid 6-phosphate etherase